MFGVVLVFSAAISGMFVCSTLSALIIMSTVSMVVNTGFSFGNL